MVRKLGLNPGAKLSVYLDDGEIVLQARPSGIMAFAGILRDNPIYGRTKEEIAEYIRWVREGGDEPGAADRD